MILFNQRAFKVHVTGGVWNLARNPWPNDAVSARNATHPWWSNVSFGTRVPEGWWKGEGGKLDVYIYVYIVNLSGMPLSFNCYISQYYVLRYLICAILMFIFFTYIYHIYTIYSCIDWFIHVGLHGESIKRRLKELAPRTKWKQKLPPTVAAKIFHQVCNPPWN